MQVQFKNIEGQLITPKQYVASNRKKVALVKGQRTRTIIPSEYKTLDNIVDFCRENFNDDDSITLTWEAQRSDYVIDL